ncbi:MAG: helix-turn-helix transcriptional regulator [Fibrobacterales bacterium]
MENLIVYENIRLPPTQKIGLRYFEPKERLTVGCQAHFHMMPEIMKFKKAQGRFIINQKVYRIKANSLVFVPSMAVHEMYLTEAEKKIFLLQFDKSIYTDLDLEVFNSLGNRPLVIELNHEENSRIDVLLDWLLQLGDDLIQHPTRKTIMRLLLLIIHDKLVSLGIHEDRLEQHKTMAKIHPLLMHLEDTQRFSITLDEAATLCNISRFHFSRLFKSYFQISFKDYLLNRKISEAINLLSRSELNITEIACKCEFSDTAYFSHKFKEIIGQTPSTFRKSQHKTDQFIIHNKS